jgi:CRISPR-associated endoribonuclease Cas6
MVWRPFGQAGAISTPWNSPESMKKIFVYPDLPTNGAPCCVELLKNNLEHKFKRLMEIRSDIASAWLNFSGDEEKFDKNEIEIEFLHHSETMEYKKMLHYGKNAPIRSWRCPVKVTAPIPVQRMIWATGLGSLNSQGYGLVREGKNVT